MCKLNFERNHAHLQDTIYTPVSLLCRRVFLELHAVRTANQRGSRGDDGPGVDGRDQLRLRSRATRQPTKRNRYPGKCPNGNPRPTPNRHDAFYAQINGNDHYILNTIIFSSKVWFHSFLRSYAVGYDLGPTPLQIGLEVNGAADYVTGVHVWFPGVVLLVFECGGWIAVDPCSSVTTPRSSSEPRGTLRGHDGLPRNEGGQ